MNTLILPCPMCKHPTAWGLGSTVRNTHGVTLFQCPSCWDREALLQSIPRPQMELIDCEVN